MLETEGDDDAEERRADNGSEGRGAGGGLVRSEQAGRQAASERARGERVRVERLVGAQPRKALATLLLFQDLTLNHRLVHLTGAMALVK